MEMGFSGSALSLATVFRGKLACEGKNCDSSADVLHVAAIQFLI